MNEETTSGLQIRCFMEPIYPVIVPAAITAMTVSLVTFDQRRDQHGNQLYLPVSNAPDQPHQHCENNEPVGTMRVEWSLSGTNTSAALTSTTWTSTTLILPFDSDPYIVTRLRQTGLIVAVPVPVSGAVSFPS